MEKSTGSFSLFLIDPCAFPWLRLLSTHQRLILPMSSLMADRQTGSHQAIKWDSLSFTETAAFNTLAALRYWADESISPDDRSAQSDIRVMEEMKVWECGWRRELGRRQMDRTFAAFRDPVFDKVKMLQAAHFLIRLWRSPNCFERSSEGLSSTWCTFKVVRLYWRPQLSLLLFMAEWFMDLRLNRLDWVEGVGNPRRDDSLG